MIQTLEHSSTATLAASTYEPGLKFKDGQLVSDITLWSEGIGGNIKIDNLTVSVPADATAGVVDTTTNALNALTETYKADYEPKVAEMFGIAPLTPTAGKEPAAMSITADGSLKMSAGSNWGSHLITLAPADMINGDNGKVIIDMKLAANNGKRLTVLLVNNDVSAETSYNNVTNVGAVGYRLSPVDDNKLKTWTQEFNSSGGGISGENKENESVYVQCESYVFDIRIIADGSTYSLYVNGTLALTKSYASDAKNKTVNADTSLVLWVENTEITISDLTISTFKTAN